MKIIIAEKPSAAKEIAPFFGATVRGDGCITGNGVAVTWCFGHLFEQADPDEYDDRYKKWNLADLPIVPAQWKLLKKSDAAKQIKVIGDLLKQATEIVHAGDPDREGQLLVDEVIEHFKCKAPVKRLWLAAMDEASIRKAVSSMRDGNQYRGLKESAEARSRADWLVGMNLTRAWSIHGKKYNHDTLSVGRVQTPTLAMIVSRDLAIENFKSRDFYIVEGQFNGEFKAKWLPGDNVTLDEEGRLLDSVVADIVATKVSGKTSIVTRYESKPCRQAAPLPYSLSALQQKASSKFGFSAKQVLDIAQALYETHKVTSYPRTDCRYLPDSMHGEAARILAALRSQGDPSIKTGAFNDKKVTAHHAIIPTGKIPSGLSDAEQKIYDLVVKSYVSQFYPDYTYQQVNIALEVEGETFTTSGRTPIDQGWKVVFGAEADEDDEDEKEVPQSLPECTIGQSILCQSASVTGKKTTPPKRYTDGSLIGDMANVQKYIEDPEMKKRLRETAGIGTEATRANIIETLLRRQFIEKKGKNLISLPAGRALIEALGNSELTNAGMTAQFEDQLDDIAQGRLEQSAFLKNVVASISTQVAVFSSANAPVMKMGNAQPRSYSSGGSSSKKPAPAAVKGKKCPKCGSAMVKRNSAKGAFLGCSTFPACRGTANI